MAVPCPPGAILLLLQPGDRGGRLGESWPRWPARFARFPDACGRRGHLGEAEKRGRGSLAESGAKPGGQPRPLSHSGGRSEEGKP
jgi:hypothetical protein